MKQTDTATAALVQRVQEQFNTDIETAENAVRKMQKALSAAMKAETQNKNAAETGDDIRHSLKDAMKIGFDKLIKQFFDKKISRANPIFISNAPKNAEAMFKTNVPFIISSSDMTKSTRENNGSSRSAHALSQTFIEHLPQNIEEFVIGYLENRNGVNSFTFVCFDEESNSLVAVGGALNVLYEGQTVNRVLSIFHISTPESFLTKSWKDIVTTDIEKAKNILEKARIQSPALQDILDSARIVTQTNSGSQEKNQKNNVDGDTLHSKKDKPAVSAYTERYGTEITSQAQEDRAKVRSDAPLTEQFNIDNAENAAYNNNRNGGEQYDSNRVDRGLAEGVPGRQGVSGNSQERRIRGTSENRRGSEVVPRRDLSRQLRTAYDKSSVDAAELYDYSADGTAFSYALDEARESDKENGWCVTPKSVDELNGNLVLMDKNGSIGAVVTPDGDIEAVFKNKETNRTRRAMDGVMPQAIAAGGKKLDCYGAGLVKLYERYGFVAVARVEFNEEYANPGWDASKGKPDIFVMMHNGDSAETVVSKIGTYPHMSEEQLAALPLYDKDSYDSAMEYRDKLLEDHKKRATAQNSKKDTPRRVIPTPEEARALDEKIKAREAEKEAERIRIRNESMRKLVENAPANVALRERNNIKRSAKDNLAEMAEKNGRMQQGESPVRDVTVPVSTDGETKVRRTVRTAMEAEATPKEMIPHIEESIVEGNFNYKPKKNAKTMEAAREWVERRVDVKKAYEDWLSEKKRRLNADMIARGFIIYNNLSNACVNATTETERTELREKAISILQDISVMGTVAGQTAQAIRLLKQQPPESQYYALERAVRKLQDGINERYGDKQNDAPKIEIDKERAAKWIQALREGDMELAYDLEEVLFQQIAKQIPKTLSDRLNAWRYLSMLGNPKTLIRNAVGNAAFTPIVMAKDQIGALMEKLLPKEQRTKYFGSLHASAEGRALLKFASEDALSSDVQQMMERNKYDDTNVNDRLARAVTERRRTFDAPVLKQWQAATRYMMEKMPGMGDEFYKGIHYRRAFAGAAMARGYTVADFTSGRVSETELIKLRTYATNQAMKATFNDANKVSDLVSRFRFKNKFWNTTLEGTLPFKRTPANVAVRSFEYSPLSLLRSLTTDLYALKTGKITGQEYIEHLAQGVTGTVLFGLGWLAAATGIVRVGTDDDDEREGRQSYSLELFGESITLDWLAPTSVAFFMGAEARELFFERDMGESFLDAAIDAGSNIFAPVLEMTALSGAKDLLDTFVYSYNKDGADAGQIVQALFVQPFLSYLGQFAPTVFGQFENMFEPYRTTTYVGDIQSKVDRTFVRNIAKILEKVPFVDWRQIEYVDDWGRKDYDGNVFLRFFNSFINPAYVNDIVATDVDTEVRRIKQSTGTNVSPKRRGYQITVTDYDENGDEISSEKVTLSAEQFEAYQMEYGKQYALMSASLMASTYYDTLSDKEKAKAFKEIESLADEYGKIAAGVGYVLDKSSTDNKLYELVEAGMPVAEAYAARLMYTQLSKDEDLTPVERYEKFRVWVYGNDEWTDAEKAAVIERFGKFSSGFVAKSENFDEMIESGSIDADVANSINSGIRNLEPEDGKDEASVYQKYDYILSREDLSPSQKDAAIIAYMGEQEATRFKPCADSGVSATTYANVALRIHELKPTGGRPSVNDGQKFEVCVNAVSSEKQQDALLNRYMDSNQSAKYEKARSAGITPTLYVKYYNAKYTYGDGNGSWTQDELQRWLDANVSSRSQKATLWELTNSGWKNNPYK